MVKRNIRYEEIVLDTNFKRFAQPFSGYAGSLFNFFARGGSAARSRAVAGDESRDANPLLPPIAVGGDTYTVAFAADNKAVAEDAISFATESMARDYMSRKIAADRSLADRLHVIPAFERAA